MNIDQFMAGIRATESGSTSGNYTLTNSRSGAYGAYQFLERYWGDFLRYAGRVGRVPSSKAWPPGKAAQDVVFRGMVEYYANKYDGNLDLVAVAWHCGHTCADAAVQAYGTRATPNQINSAVAAAKGGVHSNEIAYIRNVYQKQGLSFDANAVSTTEYTTGSGPTGVTLKRGDRGDDVTKLQQELIAAGHKITADGVYGPATEAAVRAYQKANGMTVDGKAGPQTLGSLGIGSGGTSAGGGTGTGTELLLPGNAKLWYDSTAKQHLVVYEVPRVKRADGTMTDKLYTAWTVETDADLEAIVGVGVKPVINKTVSQAELTKLGVVNFGGVDEFRNFEHIEGDPFDSWVEDMATYAVTQPWILDPEWSRLSVMAVMERDDAQLTDAEIRSTEWWRTHSEEERRWLELYNSDPATAENWIADSRNATFQMAREAGIGNITHKMSNWLADMVTTGQWTKDYLDSQIQGMADNKSGVKLDRNLLHEMSAQKYTPDKTQEKENDVRLLLNKWLGPVYGDWNDERIANKAGQLRNNPDTETNFVEWLKDQRVAMLPNNADRETSYQDLAAPWSNFGRQAWGQEMDETDPLFLKLLKNNDAAENGALLQQEGLKRDVGKVVNDTRGAITEAFGGAVSHG